MKANKPKFGLRWVGGIYIAISFLITVLTLFFFRKSGITNWGDLSSIGQLAFDFLLLPVAIIGFIIAFEEFNKTREIPNLDLTWEVSPNHYSKCSEIIFPPTNYISEPISVRPVVQNNGSIVSNWFLVQFDIPIKMYKDNGLQDINITKKWAPQIGNASSWHIDLLEETMRIVFMSNGNVASYPGFSLPLGILSLQNQTGELNIPYIIFSDKINPINGSLAIIIRQDGFTRNQQN
jgi:hypothetical protein